MRGINKDKNVNSMLIESKWKRGCVYGVKFVKCEASSLIERYGVGDHVDPIGRGMKKKKGRKNQAPVYQEQSERKTEKNR